MTLKKIKEFDNGISTDKQFFTTVTTKMTFEDDTVKDRSVSMPEPEFRRCVEEYFKCPSLAGFVSNAGVLLRGSGDGKRSQKYEYTIEADTKPNQVKISKKTIGSDKSIWIAMPESVFQELVQEYYDCPDLKNFKESCT